MTTVLIPNVQDQMDAAAPTDNGLASDAGVRARMTRAMEKTPFDFRTPHVTARNLVDLMDVDNARETVKQNWRQMLTALLPIRTSNKGNQAWTNGITSEAKIKKSIARDVEDSKVFGKGHKGVAVTSYNPEGGALSLNVIVKDRAGHRTEHDIAIQCGGYLWTKQGPNDSMKQVVLDDPNTVNRIRAFAHTNDPKFKFG